MDPVRSSRLAAAAYLAGVRDPRVLEAAAEVPRAAYVPRQRAREAQRDRAIRIGGGQFTSQPSLIAVMLEALGLRGEERVLEVGAGLGYQTALLARLAREVWSVERIPELAAVAAANLAEQRVQNATVVLGDGSEGLPDSAPFDAIVVAAAHPRVPPPLAAQLAPGGRLVQPIGPSGLEDVTLFRRTAEGMLVRVRSLAPRALRPALRAPRLRRRPAVSRSAARRVPPGQPRREYARERVIARSGVHRGRVASPAGALATGALPVAPQWPNESSGDGNTVVEPACRRTRRASADTRLPDDTSMGTIVNGDAHPLTATKHPRPGTDQSVPAPGVAAGQHGEHALRRVPPSTYLSTTDGAIVFLFFSNRLGCLGSLLVSALVTIVLLLILGVL